MIFSGVAPFLDIVRLLLRGQLSHLDRTWFIGEGHHHRGYDPWDYLVGISRAMSPKETSPSQTLPQRAERPFDPMTMAG
jgi:hypothetical protein